MTALLPICEVPLACLWVHVKVMGQNHHCVCLSVSLSPHMHCGRGGRTEVGKIFRYQNPDPTLWKMPSSLDKYIKTQVIKPYIESTEEPLDSNWTRSAFQVFSDAVITTRAMFF